MHDISLITTIAFGFTAALVFGILARRFGLSPIVGYLLAGIVAGPHTPGFVGDTKLAAQLAEIGVILLMFGVGLHFHLKDLLAVRSIAIPGALGQSVLATLCSLGVALAAGWSWQDGLVLGVAVSVASTVVLMRVLMDDNSLETPAGHVAVGWLIVEDLITVLVLVILPAVAAKGGQGGGVLAAAGIAVLKLAVLGVIVAFAGARFVPWLLLRVARLRSRELFTLAVLVMSIAVATASYAAFGASMALGAFLAGMLVGQSKFSHQAGAEMLPLRDAFAVLFFVSVGMLFDYRAVLETPWLMLGVLGVVLVVKPLAAFFIVLICRHTLRTALTVAGGLAQIGEFSFILAESARKLGLMPGSGHAVLVAAAIVSISLNPLLFKWLLKLEPVIDRNPKLSAWLRRRSETRGAELNASVSAGEKESVEAIIVGYGPVGQTASRLLREFGIHPLIVEMNIDTVSQLRAEGRRALFGDASRREILKETGIAKARFLILTLPSSESRLPIINLARELNPEIKIFARARYLAEQSSLLAAGVTRVSCEEAEIAENLAEVILLEMGMSQDRIDDELPRLRDKVASIREEKGHAGAAPEFQG